MSLCKHDLQSVDCRFANVLCAMMQDQLMSQKSRILSSAAGQICFCHTKSEGIDLNFAKWMNKCAKQELSRATTLLLTGMPTFIAIAICLQLIQLRLLIQHIRSMCKKSVAGLISNNHNQ